MDTRCLSALYLCPEGQGCAPERSPLLLLFPYPARDPNGRAFAQRSPTPPLFRARSSLPFGEQFQSPVLLKASADHHSPLSPLLACACSLTGTTATYSPVGTCLNSWACKLLKGPHFLPLRVSARENYAEGQPVLMLFTFSRSRAEVKTPVCPPLVHLASQWRRWGQGEPHLHIC